MAKNRDDNLDYWRKREEEARQNTIKDEAEYNKRLDGIYNSMQVNIEKEINGFYSRYATKNGISMAEARKRVQNADMEALSRKAEKYVREKDFSDRANEEMELYNLAMKTNRLELLKAQIELELIDGFNDVEHEMEKDLLKTSMKEYERMAGILGKSVKDAEKHAHELVNTSFRNAHFSDRVWYSEWSLKVELERLLRIGLIQGRNPNVLMRDVEKALKVSKYEARRVMVTEMCRVQTGAQKQTYERNGYDQYTFIVEHDDRLCDDCRDLDGQIFYVKDMAPGHNAPPIHCFCRCSTSAYADRARLDALIAQIEAERNGDGYKPVKNLDEAQGRLADILGRAHENRRERFSPGLSKFTPQEAKEAFMQNANFGKKMDVEMANGILKALTGLVKDYTTTLSEVRPMTGLEYMSNSNSFAGVYHTYSTNESTLMLNLSKLNHYDKHIDRVRELSDDGFLANVPNGREAEYMATHEFAHTIIGMTDKLSNKRNFVGTDYGMIKSARREIDKVYTNYLNALEPFESARSKAELESLEAYSKGDMDAAMKADEAYAKADESYRKICISEYSKENADEFLAESFTQCRMNNKDDCSEYAKKAMSVLDKYFKR